MDLEKSIMDNFKREQEEIKNFFPLPFNEVKAEIMKAKRAQVGEIREWGGVKMRKEANGWVPVKGEAGKPKAEETPSKEGGETPSIQEHAKKASEAALQNAIKNSPDPEVRAAAHRELERRTKEEKSEMFSKPEGEAPKEEPKETPKAEEPVNKEPEPKKEESIGSAVKSISDLGSPKPHQHYIDGKKAVLNKTDKDDVMHWVVDGKVKNIPVSEMKQMIKEGRVTKEYTKKEEPTEEELNNRKEEKQPDKKIEPKEVDEMMAIPNDRIVNNSDKIKSLATKFEGGTLSGSENLKKIKGLVSASNKKIKEIKDKFPNFNSISQIPSIIENIGEEEYKKLHNEWVNAANNLSYVDKFARNQLKKEGMSDKKITMELDIFPKKEAWKYNGKSPSEVYGEGGLKQEQDSKDTVNADKFSSSLENAISKWMEESVSNGGNPDNPSGKAVDDILSQLDSIDSGMGTLGEVIGEKLSYLDPSDKDSVKRVISEIKNKIVRNKGKLPDFKSVEIKKSLSDDLIEKRTTYKFLEGQSNLLQKSHINEFVFNDNFSVAKTGLELKKKFEEQLKLELEEIRENSRKAVECLKEIGEQPDTSFEDEYYYMVDGYEDKIQHLPMIFKNSGKVIGMDTSEQTNTLLSKKYDYNNLAHKIVDGMIEVLHLNTLINSMLDGKTYKLNIKQAAILGF